MFEFPDRLARLAFIASLGLGTALATPQDPTRTLRVFVGRPAGPAPMVGFDTAHSYSTRLPLPERPAILWRARVSAGIRGDIVTDGKALVAITNGNSLVQLDVRGKETWSARPAAGALLARPAITAKSERIAVSSSGKLLVASPRGQSREVSLPIAINRPTTPLPVESGGVVLCSGPDALWLTQDYGIRVQSKLPDDIIDSVARAEDVLLVTTRGDVFGWRPPAAPRRLASFGGRVGGGVALSSPTHVTAVVDGVRLVDVNLKSDTRHIRLQSTTPLQGPPTLLTSGEVLVTTSQGLLLGYDRSGLETWRVATEPALAAAGAASVGADAPAVIGGSGRVAVARPGLDVALISADGTLVAAPGTACTDPESLVPLAPRRLVLACADGELFGIGSGKASR
ncbi:MAG: PQQ-binding-like beta-propeller repeat protein [Polyangiaceae bacterium]